MATVNELVTALGFELKPDAIKNINTMQVGISHLQEAVGKLGKMFTGGKSFTDFFSSTLIRSQDLENTAKAIGLSADALQEWQYAATASGVSAESVTQDLDHLHNEMFLSEKGVLNLADSFKKMSAEGARLYGSRIGLSRDTILLLRQGSEAIKDLQARAPKLTDEQIKKNAELKKKIEASKKELETMAQTVVSKATPALLKMFEAFNNWLGDDPERTEIIIQGITVALASLAGSQILTGIGEVVGFVKSLGVGLVSLGPGAGILAGIGVAIYGLYKDFQAYKEGGESLLPWETIVGDFEIAADKIAEALDDIKDKWRQFKGWLNSEQGSHAKGAAKAVWEAEKELIIGSSKAAWEIVNWGGALIGGALNTKGGLLRPVDMMKNALTMGNLSLQNSETLRNAGWDKYFLPSPTNKSVEFSGAVINVYSSQNFGDIMSSIQNEVYGNNSGPVTMNVG